MTKQVARIVTLVKLPVSTDKEFFFRDVFTGEGYKYLLRNRDLPCRLRPGMQTLEAMNAKWQRCPELDRPNEGLTTHLRQIQTVFDRRRRDAA